MKKSFLFAAATIFAFSIQLLAMEINVDKLTDAQNFLALFKLKDAEQPPLRNELDDIPAHVFHQNLLKRDSDGWNYPTNIELFSLKDPPTDKGTFPVGDNIAYFRAREFSITAESRTIYEVYYWIQTDVFPRISGWIGETPLSIIESRRRNHTNPDFEWHPSFSEKK